MSYLGSGYFGTGYFGGGYFSGGASGTPVVSVGGLVRISLTDKLVNSRVTESSVMRVTARFWDDTNDQWTAVVPTTVRYRIDNPTNNTQIVGWTSLTPAAVIVITVTPAQNAIVNDSSSEERRQMTVEVDAGLETQYQEVHEWWVVNLAGQT